MTIHLNYMNVETMNNRWPAIINFKKIIILSLFSSKFTMIWLVFNLTDNENNHYNLKGNIFHIMNKPTVVFFLPKT